MTDREIRFRAFNKYRKTMEEVSSISWDLLEVNREAMKDYVLMQSTSLKDKTGREIYEGDFVQSQHGDGYVVWNPLGYWDLKLDGCLATECMESDDWGIPFYVDSEVIGNQFENPELLTDSQPESEG